MARDGKSSLALIGVVYQFDNGVLRDARDRGYAGVRFFDSVLWGVHARMMFQRRLFQ
jgi:hypothetical protein